MYLHLRVTKQTFGVRKHVLPKIFALIDEILVLTSILLGAFIVGKIVLII